VKVVGEVKVLITPITLICSPYHKRSFAFVTIVMTILRFFATAVSHNITALEFFFYNSSVLYVHT
jgi:hypothetical protein